MSTVRTLARAHPGLSSGLPDRDDRRSHRRPPQAQVIALNARVEHEHISADLAADVGLGDNTLFRCHHRVTAASHSAASASTAARTSGCDTSDAAARSARVQKSLASSASSAAITVCSCVSPPKLRMRSRVSTDTLIVVGHTASTPAILSAKRPPSGAAALIEPERSPSRQWACARPFRPARPRTPETMNEATNITAPVSTIVGPEATSR